MMRRKITFKGESLNLVGRHLKTYKPAPDFKVVSPDLEEITLKNFIGKTKIITSFPSLDTLVCGLQVKEFNQRAKEFPSQVSILGISKDSPFTQKRFCDTFNITNVTLASDYKFSSFGVNYGLLIKELGLLARAVVILDHNNILRYVQVVEELTSSPNYDDIVTNVEEVVYKLKLSVDEDSSARCLPCEGGVRALSQEKIDKLIVEYNGWELIDNKKLVKEFKFKDFQEAKYFLDLIAIITEEQGHHPTLSLIYNKLRVSLTTHAAGGLTDNDFIMAKIIDQLEI